MIHTWTSQFEGYPTESDRGSVTNLAQRNIKEAFGERFSENHYLDPLVGAECYHLLGKSTVVEIVDETPSTNLVEGGVQHYGGLFYDNGITMDGASAGDHTTLINREASDHPQYIERDAIAGFVEITGPISFGTSDKLSGMQTTYATPNTKEAISRGQHLGVAGAGGSKHLDEMLVLAGGDKIGYGKLKIASTNYDFNITGDWISCNFADFCFMPLAIVSPSDATVLQLALSTVDSDDYVGRIALTRVAGTNGVWTFKCYYPDT